VPWVLHYIFIAAFSVQKLIDKKIISGIMSSVVLIQVQVLVPDLSSPALLQFGL